MGLILFVALFALFVVDSRSRLIHESKNSGKSSYQKGPVHLPMGHRIRRVRNEGAEFFVRNPRNTPVAKKRARKFGHKVELIKDLPLRGNWTNLGLWYITLDVGIHAETFHVQVDTGSSDVGIPDAGCNCGSHLDPPFDPKTYPGASPASCNTNVLDCTDSGAFCQSGQCGYTISYEDGSGYTALIYNDTVIVGSRQNNGLPIKSQYFGAITKEVTPNGPFEPAAVDGIAGFAQTFLSVVEAPTLIQSLKDQTGCPRIFSMCGDVSQAGGVLSLCGYGNHYSGQIQWTPMVNYDQGFYQIYTVDMAVAGTRLNLPSSDYNNGGTICDSGTTLAYIVSPALKKIKSILLANCTNNKLVGVCDVDKDSTIFDGNCFRLTQSQFNQYPVISLIAGKDSQITIDFPAKAYITPGFCSDPVAYTSSFQDGGAVGNGLLLGDPLMVGNMVVYDVENKRMGFAPKANCVFSNN